MEYLPSYKDELYLAHHGIKGQKWGVRRFQNSDGSLTPEGRKRANQHAKAGKGKGIGKAIVPKKINKQTGAKIAKGAAIAAGLVAGSYGAMILSEEVKATKDFQEARKLTDDLVKKHLSDLTDEQKIAAKQIITNRNSKNLSDQRVRRSRARKGFVKDVFDAYISPKTASFEKRSAFRSNRQAGYYRVPTGNLNDPLFINDRNFSKYEDNIRKAVNAPKK